MLGKDVEALGGLNGWSAMKLAALPTCKVFGLVNKHIPEHMFPMLLFIWTNALSIPCYVLVSSSLC